MWLLLPARFVNIFFCRWSLGFFDITGFIRNFIWKVKEDIKQSPCNRTVQLLDPLVLHTNKNIRNAQSNCFLTYIYSVKDWKNPRKKSSYVSEQNSLRFEADWHSMTLIVEEILQSHEFHSAHLPWIFPGYCDWQFTRLKITLQSVTYFESLKYFIYLR